MIHIIKKPKEDDDVFIPKGKWYFPCCEEDLQQSEGEYLSYFMVSEYYDTKNEALDEIKAMYERSRENIGNKSVDETLKKIEELRDI